MLPALLGRCGFIGRTRSEIKNSLRKGLEEINMLTEQVLRILNI